MYVCSLDIENVFDWETTHLKKEQVIRAWPWVVVQGEVVGEAVLEEGGGGDLEGGPEQGEGGRGRGQSVPLDLGTGALHHPRPDRFPGLTLFLENSCEATTIIKLLVCFLSSCTRC